MNRPKIAVLGIGQMGASAAVCFSRASFPVILWARDPAKLVSASSTIDEMNGFLDQHFGPNPNAVGEVELTADLGRIQESADVVLECIAENMDQKVELFRQLQPMAERNAVLSTCTSGLSITTMGARSGVGRRLVGAHFWNPPHLIPIVEVVSGAETDPGLTELMSDLLKQAGKQPVICKDVPGFIGNRLLHALFREALHLVQQGVCSAADVDLVARMTFGLRLPAVGPCANMDLVGLELVSQIQSYLLDDLCDSKGVMPIVQQYLQQGRLGMKSGQGFHSWTNQSAKDAIALRDQQIVNQLQFLASKQSPRE